MIMNKIFISTTQTRTNKYKIQYYSIKNIKNDDNDKTNEIDKNIQR